MPKVEMYSSAWCPYCVAAQRLLKSKGVDITLISIDGNPALKAEMMKRSGRRTVPQIFIDGKACGGFDEIADLDADDALDALLGLD